MLDAGVAAQIGVDARERARAGDAGGVRGRMRLYDPASYRAPARATRLPIDIIHRHPYVDATLHSRSHALVRGRFVLDLGSAQSVILTPQAVQQHYLVKSTPTIEGKAGGIGGSFVVHTGHVRSLAVGPFTAKDVLAGMPLGGVLADAGDAVGNIGGGFLRRFKVVFDYSRREMLLTPNRRFRERDEMDMSGLTLRARGGGLREVTIVNVREGSPGAKAGLRAGDRIVAVDGNPDRVTVFELRDRFRVAGQQRLDVRRGDRTIRVVLHTRRQI